MTEDEQLPAGPFSDWLVGMERDAVRAAARFVGEHDGALPAAVVPVNATQHAVLAIPLHDAFVGPEDDPDADMLRALLASRAR